jgi:signal transduction histidine kinase
MGWLAAILLVTLVRSLLLVLHRIRPKAFPTRRWAVLFVLGTSLSGIAWGLGSVALFVPGNMALQTLIAFAVGGICAAASVSTSSYFPALAGFIVPASTPLTLRLSMDLDRNHLGMAFMVALFMAALLVIGRSGARSVRQHLRLRLEKEALAARLDRALQEIEGTNRQLQDRLAESEQLARLGRLAAGVAHEINNPLAYVSANLDFVASELKNPASRSVLREAIADARQGADRIRFIVRDLTALAPSGPEVFETVHLETLLRSCIKFLGQRIEHRAKLAFSPAEAAFVAANPTRLSQVFLNLLNNAIQAIEPGFPTSNEIRITTRILSDGWVEVEVFDTGCGIPRDQARRVFDPFFTTKKVGEGTGLGLSISRHIVENCHGTLSLRPGTDRGTSFVVRLPRADPTHDAAPAEEPGPLPTQSGPHLCTPRRILIVDDDPLVARAMKRALKPHVVDVASGGKSALQWLRRFPGAHDVILCDVLMPDLHGVDLYRTIAEEQPAMTARFVFMTGATTPQTGEFLDGIPNLRLHKPVSRSDLLRLLDKVDNRGP